MTASQFLWLGMGGCLLLTLASLGTKVLYEIPWHELKDFCKRRNERQRFDRIHDGHDEVTLGMETLRCLASVMIMIAVAGYIAHWHRETPLSSPQALVWAGGLLAVVLAVAVWLPAALVEKWGVLILFHFWRLFRIASFCVFPLSLGAIGLETALRRMSNQVDEPTEEEAFEDEVLAIVTEGMHDGHLEADAREMIEGVMELGDGDVADIMTPRSKMDAVSIDQDWDSVLEFVTTCGRTRIPVYLGGLDRIVGILYVKDLLAELSKHGGRPQRPLQKLLREPWYVLPTKKLDDLLNEFLQTRNHLAIVRDEFSRTAGLVTIEDVLEEIVGEIVDETDKEHVEEIRRIDECTAVIQGRAHLAEVNAALGLDLPEPEDFDTIAGYVVNHFGRIPKAGETVCSDSVQITVLQASKRKVETVRLVTQAGN